MALDLARRARDSSSVTVLTRDGETWLSMILRLLAWFGLKEDMLMLARVADGLPPPFGRV